jgi:2,3,4,5-tetrahydropyridine-2-carboxylate N-succinyltransferase
MGNIVLPREGGSQMTDARNVIENAFENRHQLDPRNADVSVRKAVDEVMDLLDAGTLRIAEKKNGDWIVHQWVKKAVLLAFRIIDSELMHGGYTNYFDKIPSKFARFDGTDFRRDRVRIVPPASARRGAYIAADVVLMPSYINIGAYVDTGTMVDTWATVGSCAQIGRNVHLSGGVGIGGVLEPLQAAPTIIEDNCFIGARSEIVEGVIVEEASVISMGVYVGQSTRIYHRETGKITFGRIPAGSVVVPGNLPSEDGRYSLYCAVIVKQVDEKTRSKVGINELLRSL